MFNRHGDRRNKQRRTEIQVGADHLAELLGSYVKLCYGEGGVGLGVELCYGEGGRRVRLN